MAIYQCQICGAQSSVKSPKTALDNCMHEWEVLPCEKTYIKWYWRCKFCGNYPTGSGNGNGLSFPRKSPCFDNKRKGLSCVWERLIPDYPKYDDKNWLCMKCNKTANQLSVNQAYTGYNVPGLGRCLDNKPNNHIWKRIK